MLGLTIKTANSNSPWTYIREGLLSEGFLRLRFGGLIFRRAYFGGGGAYYRNFTVFKMSARELLSHRIYSFKRPTSNKRPL